MSEIPVPYFSFAEFWETPPPHQPLSSMKKPTRLSSCGTLTTKKFLKKHQVRDWLRVLASDIKGERNTYELRYFKLNEESGDEESDEE